MPLSSRVDMVLCTIERKKFTTELDMNLMLSNCIHGTENKYCKWHNIMNAYSCLWHTYLSGISELVHPSLGQYVWARNVSSSVVCCLGVHARLLLHCSAPSKRKVFLHLSFRFLLKARFGTCNLKFWLCHYKIVQQQKWRSLCFKVWCHILCFVRTCCPFILVPHGGSKCLNTCSACPPNYMVPHPKSL